MTIANKLKLFRQLMSERNIDAYIVPSADNHQSEYVDEHFKSMAFITGFTGSSGTAVITQTQAGLWTDGRYFIQAEKELYGSGITLYKSGKLGVPTVDEFLDTVLPEHGTLGFDGRLISLSQGKQFTEKLAYKDIRIEDNYDLIDMIWEDRPPLPTEPVYLLEETFTGESTISKINRIRTEMKKIGATCHILITLDDIAWLLNMRGNDVAYTPVVLCYAAITLDHVHLFINEEKLSGDIKEKFDTDGIILHPYNDIYNFVASMSSVETLLIDPTKLNYALFHKIPTDAKIIEQTNPCVLLKTIKNDVEIQNIQNAHVKDAVACTKFMYWLKTNFDKETITELSASAKLEQLRAEQEHFISPSFAPISAYGSNAAMCHYSSTEETNCALKDGSFYLSDTGGHYLEGSTDITRTIALGTVSDELKRDFTNVLRGNLALANAKFLYGCTGENLDILARQFLWNMELNYNHGTGHGVGYLLSIHEDPCRINWKQSTKACVLEEGMVLSDEPGLYIEGSHGIRLENELLVRKGTQNEYGQFMYFEVLTLVPFDLDAVDFSLLQENEKTQLNAYHKQVYDMVAPYLNDDEKIWLKEYTREL